MSSKLVNLFTKPLQLSYELDIGLSFQQFCLIEVELVVV